MAFAGRYYNNKIRISNFMKDACRAVLISSVSLYLAIKCLEYQT